MTLHWKDSVMPPLQKSNIVTPGVEPMIRATKLAAPQNPIHDRAVSTLDNAIQTITLMNNFVTLPVVKGVLLSVAGILGIVKKAITNQDDFQELAEQCQMVVLVVWRATSGTPEHQLDGTMHRALADLKGSVDGILEAVKAKAEKSLGSKAFHATVNQEIIVKWRNEMNRFLTLFNTELNISTNLKLDELLSLFQEYRSTVTVNLQTEIQVPDLLPARPRIFVGRDDLVQNTTDILLKFHHVALIGPGGIGKSSIARAVLNNEAIVSKFQQRRFFIRFDDMDAVQVNLGTFLDRIARGLGFATSANAHNLITRALSISETLVVLDNAETFLDAAVDAGQIADAIDGFGARPNVAILLTTRTTVLPPNLDWARLRVPVLEESAACEAFKAFYPSINTSVLTKLLSVIDFHPLSINLLAQAAVQNEWSPQDLVTAWDRQCTVLLEMGGGKFQSIAVTIETSLNSPSFIKLGETIHHLLQIIAFLPQGISKMRLTAIFPGVSNIERYADALCRQSLASLNGNYITLLAPIRLYILKRYNSNISTNSLLRDVRLYYSAHVKEPDIVAQDSMNIEHVLIHWLRDSKLETIFDVLKYISLFVITLTVHRPRAVSLRPVISALDVNKSHRPRSRMNFTMVIPIPISRRPKISRAKSLCLLSISVLMRTIGQMEEAEEAHAEARAVALKAGNLDILALIDSVVAMRLENYQATEPVSHVSLKHLPFSPAVYRGERERKSKSLFKLGVIHLKMVLKEMPKAFHVYIESLPVLKREFDPRIIGLIQFTAGFIAIHDGRLDDAKKCFKEMQASLNELEPLRVLGSIGLAEVADRQDDHTGSKELRAQSLELVQMMPDQTREDVNLLTALLAAYLAMDGNLKQARELISSSVINAIQYPSVNTPCCKYMAGMVEMTDGNFNKAEGYFRETVKDCISFADLHCHAISHRALGEIALVRQDLVAAREHFEATTELCKTAGMPKERMYLGFTCTIPSGKFDGWRLYQEGHVMFSDIGVNVQV